MIYSKEKLFTAEIIHTVVVLSDLEFTREDNHHSATNVWMTIDGKALEANRKLNEEMGSADSVIMD